MNYIISKKENTIKYRDVRKFNRRQKNKNLRYKYLRERKIQKSKRYKVRVNYYTRM